MLQQSYQGPSAVATLVAALRLPLLTIGIALLALLLAGCVGNSVTVAGQGYTSGTKTKTLDCGSGKGTISLGVQGAGKMEVSVTDAGGKTLFSDGGVGSGQNGQSQALSGQAGTWTLRVSTGFGFSGQYGITLTC